MGSFRSVPPTKRFSAFGTLDHLLNPGVGRMTLFEEEADWRASLDVIGELCGSYACRVAAAARCRTLGTFCSGQNVTTTPCSILQRLTNKHVQQWQHHRHCGATGMFIRADTSRFPFRRTTTTNCSVTSREMPCGQRGPSGQRGPKTDADRATRTPGVGRAFRHGDPRTRTKLGRWPDRFSAALAGRNRSTNHRQKRRSKRSGGRPATARSAAARPGAT